jgi:phosphoglycerate dehydrogenase-like enzyme
MDRLPRLRVIGRPGIGYDMENVILTPHTAGLSDSSQVAVRQRTTRNVAAALVGDWPETRDLVNPAVRGHPRQRCASA